MTTLVEVRMPHYPDCWDNCGSCASGEVVVQSLLVRPGDQVRIDDTLLVLETGKVALDIPSPKEGRVVEVCVSEGEPLAEDQLILTLAPS